MKLVMINSLLITFIILIISMNTAAQVTGNFTDPRDGKTYKTVEIGTQTWMAENLAYKVEKGCWAYDNNQSNVKTYGYLYDWKIAKEVCPSGWHLPSDSEWTILSDYLTSNGFGYEGSGNDIGKSLASISDWVSTDNKLGSGGTVGNDQSSNNLSGFTAHPGGMYVVGLFPFFIGITSEGNWWSST
jgi:uncharacterized protein (TIGR02145 family)